MKRIVVSIVATALLLWCCLGTLAWTPPQDEGGLDLGGQWYRSEGVGGAYVVQEDGSVLHTDTGWFCQRAYIGEVGSDCTVEMTFTPASEYVYWGVVARLDSPVMPQEVGNGGCITARILGTDGLQVTGQAGGNTPIADYAGGQKYVLRMVLSGSQVSVYLNDMETPVATVANESTGKYAGFYLAQGSGSVIHSYQVNGKSLLGKTEDEPIVIPPENLDPNLGNGEEWYIPNGGGGAYVAQADGSVLHTDTGWFCQRAYVQEVGSDCTIEMTFTPTSEYVYWGIVARMDSPTAMPLEVGEGGCVTARILGADGLQVTGQAGGNTPIADYAGGQKYVLRMVLSGSQISVYLNDMETPIATGTSERTGKYAGFYIAQGSGSVIHSYKVNGEFLLGGQKEEDPPEVIPDENLDPNLGLGAEWYFPNGGGGVYTLMDDGTYVHSDTTWYCHRTYLEKVGPDCTIEFNFTPSTEFAYWGVYARLDRVTDTPLELSDINGDLGVRLQILGTDGLYCTGMEGREPVEDYSGGQAHTMKLVLNGNKATVYFDDMDTPFGEYEVAKTTGDYVGFYVAQGNDSVIQSLKINNELVLGVDLDQAEADNVMDLIDELPSTDDLTLNHRSAVLAVRRAYNALTSAQQKLVTQAHLDRLQAAEQRIEELKQQEEADKEKAKEVDDAVNALPSIKALAKTDKEAVDGAWAKYEALSESQKTYVTTLETLEAAKARLALLLAASDADIAAAKAADEAIDAIPSLEELAYTDKELVDEARRQVDALSDGQKALLLGLETLKAAEKRIAELRPNVKYGDISGDGNIDASDALLALQHSVRLIQLEGDKFTAGDVTGDGVIDASDALCILQYSVSLIDQFEVEKA